MKRFFELRAHHILCIQGFCGYGYDGQFTENLSKIYSDIKNNKIKKVRIIIKSDPICKSCPYCKNELCLKRRDGKVSDVNRFDLKVLKILNLKASRVKSLSLLFKITNERPEITQKLKRLCQQCEWIEKCLWFCRNC